MDIGDIKYLEAPAKVLKLSEVVRARGYASWSNWNECVLGRAGRLTFPDTPRLPRENYREFASRNFHVPLQVCMKAERMCMFGKPAAAIADWLESKGF